MSQDCELDQDYAAFGGGPQGNRSLPNILFCEVIEATVLRGQQKLNAGLWRRVEKNDHDRYHVLSEVSAQHDAAAQGLPALGMDFKRYFTVPTDEVYRRLQAGQIRRRCCLVSPHREHMSTRFFGFLMRVALPDQMVVPAGPAPAALEAVTDVGAADAPGETSGQPS